MEINKKAILIRSMIVAIEIAYYNLIELKDGTHHELKRRVGKAMEACKQVEQYFLTHQDGTQKSRDAFRANFLSDEIVLLAELHKTCFGLDADSIEIIINAVKKNTEQKTEV